MKIFQFVLTYLTNDLNLTCAQKQLNQLLYQNHRIRQLVQVVHQLHILIQLLLYLFHPQ